MYREQPWVRGIANIRGNLLPVIDLSGCLTGGVTRITGKTRVLVIDYNGFYSGLIVDEVLGMKHFMDNEYSVEDAQVSIARSEAERCDRCFLLPEPSSRDPIKGRDVLSARSSMPAEVPGHPGRSAAACDLRSHIVLAGLGQPLPLHDEQPFPLNDDLFRTFGTGKFVEQGPGIRVED